MLSRILLICALCLSFNGCSLFSSENERSANKDEWTAEDFYQEAQKSISKKDLASAIEHLQDLDARFPFGEYAELGQLSLIQVYYDYGELDSAIAASDRFIRFFGDHPELDFAYYMRGKANFESDIGFLQRFLPTDKSKRDIGRARESFQDFSQLIRLFPDSQYVPEAQQRMVHTRNLLAQYELHVARYYITRNAPLAAANRARYIVEHYQGALAIPEALQIMLSQYQVLGLDHMVEHTQSLIDLNADQLTPLP